MPLEDWTHLSHFCHTYYYQSSKQAYYAATSETLGKQKVATKGNNNQIQHQVEDLRLCYNLDERTTKLDEAGLDRLE